MRIREVKANVLAYFHEAWKEHGAGLIIVDPEDMVVGADPATVREVLQELDDEGIIAWQGSAARLTGKGIRSFEEPGSEESQLLRFAQINVHGGNVQIGDRNQQIITYASVLTSLAEAIEKAPDVPAEQKRRWTAALGELAAHPLTQTAISAAAGIGGALLGK
jgi:hypothetical protein